MGLPKCEDCKITQTQDLKRSVGYQGSVVGELLMMSDCIFPKTRLLLYMFLQHSFALRTLKSVISKFQVGL